MRFKTNTKIKVIAVSLAVLLLAILLVSTVLAEGPTPTPTPVPSPFGQGGGFGWGPRGMMGQGYGIGPSTGITGTIPYGPGGCPMYGGWGGSTGTGIPISIDQAIEAARQYVAAYGNPDPSTGSGQVLTLTEVMEFTNNFYAEVAEKSTGVHAFELLINRYTGAVSPETGPNMMWNTKYGHMGGLMGGMMRGMMGGWWGQPGGAMTVTPEQAKQKAQQWLNTYLSGTTVAGDADPFYGYYTIHVMQNGQVYGMLSVNGYSGQVWYHTWHGDFIGMRELAS